MNPIQLLKAQARDKRDAAIRQARLEHLQTAREIAILARMMSDGPDRKRKYQVVRRRVAPDDGPLSGMTAIGAAEAVVRELGPLSLVQLTLEVQRRSAGLGMSHGRWPMRFGGAWCITGIGFGGILRGGGKFCDYSKYLLIYTIQSHSIRGDDSHDAN